MDDMRKRGGHASCPIFLPMLMGGRYHQKCKNCNRFKQNRIVSLIVYRIAHSIRKWSSQNTNSSIFFIRIKQAEQKQFRPIINEIVTYVSEERATVQQSSETAISPAFKRFSNDSDQPRPGFFLEVEEGPWERGWSLCHCIFACSRFHFCIFGGFGDLGWSHSTPILAKLNHSTIL